MKYEISLLSSDSRYFWSGALKIYHIFLFVSESLIEAIHSDIREAEQALEKPENQAFLTHTFFSKTDNDNASGCT